ncbi:unnamed protein product [Bursaphelenchus okinawaensis]|uniref:Signal recognition particle 19 kDa protein n=1 Tax=Bursaphelenchus okinawaensis TaxID=465554 RepID=A0A811JRG9_9BILA|nr:unnamed protein product [Bursaphelenchus okinawaensis]CAG9078975.1 unnamed protein product [Bursaphelenchus okinawaensis]
MAANAKHSEVSRWICIYPLYINSEKKLENGRRIPKDKAVKNPTAQEIYDVLVHHGLKCEIQPKVMHPREPDREPGFVGRVKVQLRNDDGSFVNEKFKNRKSLLFLAAEFIPKLKSRQDGPSASSTQAGNAAKSKKNKKR